MYNRIIPSVIPVWQQLGHNEAMKADSKCITYNEKTGIWKDNKCKLSLPEELDSLLPSAYVSSKFALEGLVESLRYEVQLLGIRCWYR